MSTGALAAPSNPMAQVAYLVGRWSGEGQFWNAEGPRRFSQIETVQSHLGGELLTIEGEGWDRDDHSRRVHAAFAVLSYETGGGRYVWQAYSGGQWADTELQVRSGGFSWAVRPAPQVAIRYTAVVGSDTWAELGELARDGGPWSTIMSMRLRREA